MSLSFRTIFILYFHKLLLFLRCHEIKSHTQPKFDEVNLTAAVGAIQNKALLVAAAPEQFNVP
jgi:hypothetical protein